MADELDLSTARPLEAPVTLDLSTAKPLSEAPPGFIHRFAQSLGIPTSKEEAQALIKDTGFHPIDLLGPLGRPLMATGKGLVQGAQTALREGSEAGQNIAEGGPVGANVGKVLSGSLEGTLQAVPGGQPVQTAGEDIAHGNKSGAAGGLIGVIAPLALAVGGPKVAPAVGDALESSAEKQLAQVLGATKEKLKAASSEHVVPGMMERGMVGMSREGLLEQAKAIVNENGPKIDAEIKAATAAGVTFPTQPILARLADIREANTVRDSAGNVTTVRPEAIKMVNDIEQTILKYGTEMTPKEVADLRRHWDTDVANSTKGFLLEQPEAELKVKREVTNALRGTLNDNLPALKEANENFSFGKDMQSILEATLQRTQSQWGGIGKVARMAKGAGVGGLVGSLAGPVGASVGGLAGGALESLMETTAWKTLSAAAKSEIADVLKGK